MDNLRQFAEQFNNPYVNQDVANYYKNMSDKDRLALINLAGQYANMYGQYPITGGMYGDWRRNPQTLGDMAANIAQLQLAERNGQLEPEQYFAIINQGYQNPNRGMPHYRGMMQ